MPSAVPEAARNVAALRTALERFLASCRRPAVLEPGEPPIEVGRDSYSLEPRGTSLQIEAWDDLRHLTRRVTAIVSSRSGRCELLVERFARRQGKLWLIDLARPQNEDLRRKGERLVFREHLRELLARRYTGWTIARLSSDADLEHSLSPAYPRALLRQGQAARAVIAAPPDAQDPSGAVTFGLIWLDYLRRRERRLVVDGLVICLPAGQETMAFERLRGLDTQQALYESLVYSGDGDLAAASLSDYGNFDTRVETVRRPPVAAEAWRERLAAVRGVECVRLNGSLSFRVRGLEFARTVGDGLAFGIDAREPAGTAHWPEIQRLAAELSRFRGEPGSPLYTRQPETWIESAVRGALSAVDPSLDQDLLYGQVPALAGGQRAVIDLLGIDGAGRLAVLELKASADPHLPMQALDYWLRVRWHLERGEFSPAGYFPGRMLAPVPPRLLLVAPALEFHPATETLLRFFDPAIEVERVGLGADWRERARVVLRARGASRPDCV